MPRHCVYMHTFPDGKEYVGQTISGDCETRWRNGEGYKGQKVYSAIKEYGWENVKHEILADNLSDREVDAYETECIDYYDAIENGYNVALGGKTNRKHKESTLLMHIIKLAGFRSLSHVFSEYFHTNLIIDDSHYDIFNFLSIVVDTNIVQFEGRSSIRNYRRSDWCGEMKGIALLQAMLLLEINSVKLQLGEITDSDIDKETQSIFKQYRQIFHSLGN